MLSSTAKYSTCLDMATVLTLERLTGLHPERRLGDADGDAQGRRLRLLRSSRRKRGLGADRHAPTPRARRDGVDDDRHDAERVRRGHVFLAPTADLGHRVSRRVRDAHDRGHQRGLVVHRARLRRLLHRGRRQARRARWPPMLLMVGARSTMARSAARWILVLLVASLLASGCEPAGSSGPSASAAATDRDADRIPSTTVGPTPATATPGSSVHRPNHPSRHRPSKAATRWPASSVRSPGATAGRTARGCPGAPIDRRSRRAVDRRDRRRRPRCRVDRAARRGRDDERDWRRRARRGPARIAFPAPPPGTWSVQVTVEFAAGPGLRDVLLAGHRAMTRGIGVAHFPRRCQSRPGGTARPVRSRPRRWSWRSAWSRAATLARLRGWPVLRRGCRRWPGRFRRRQ